MKQVMGRRLLFDGSEKELYTKTFKINLLTTDVLEFKIDEISTSNLLDTDSLLSEIELKNLKNTNKFKESAFKGEYLSIDLLPVYAGTITSKATQKKYYIVSANGEKQPMRYFFSIEGMWLIE